MCDGSIMVELPALAVKLYRHKVNERDDRYRVATDLLPPKPARLTLCCVGRQPHVKLVVGGLQLYASRRVLRRRDHQEVDRRLHLELETVRGRCGAWPLPCPVRAHCDVVTMRAP